MRKLLFFFLFPLTALSQGVYYPMLHNSKWIVKTPTQFKVHESIGDTSIQGINYVVIKTATYALSDIHLLSPSLVPGYTFLREDSTTQKVYKRNSISEDLIYNFSWTSGTQSCPFSPNIFFQQSTTTITSGVRKVLQFVDGIPPTTGFNWIESVGSLLDPIVNCYGNSKVLCNYQNGQLNYDNGSAGGISCSGLNQLQIGNDEFALNISPNPSSTGIVNINLSSFDMAESG